MNILRPHSVRPLPALLPRLRLAHAPACLLHTSPAAATDSVRGPNPPLELDPALQALLQDTDLSLLRARGRHPDAPPGRVHRELEVIDPEDAAADMPPPLAEEEEEERLFPRSERKSPAASFGSRAIGAVVLPFELQRSILRLISEADKPLVHADATRLFQADNDAEDAWSTRYTPPAYTAPAASTRMSHIKARVARHRDGTAFASVVMPAQYAVVAAVLAGATARLGPEWARRVARVVEWGSGTGAGMWAALNAFARADGAGTLAASRVGTYVGIEKREGLTTIARRLLRDVPLGSTTVSLQKALHPADRVPREAGLDTVALATFALTTLGSPSLRRQMVREMWDSGADVIIVVDDASAEGFRHVAEARDALLKLGRRELDAIAASGDDTAGDGRGARGAHVVAPCPHDGACPVLLAARAGVRCTFEQRLQRPAFVRRTKHAGLGEEDVGYAYVVVRRGVRPGPGAGAGAAGREGAVARWEEEAGRAKEAERGEREAREARWADVGAADAEDAVVGAAVVDVADTVALEAAAVGAEEVQLDDAAAADVADEDAAPLADDAVLVDQALEDALRREAYSWPRINFPPLKRSGHILIDACMPNGQEMRLTFPRSQGKQVFYDARKSSWGDLFPHTSKHRPVPRYAAPGGGTPGVKGRGTGRGGEGALAKVGLEAAGRARWGGVMDGLKEEDRRRRRERKRERGAKEMGAEE